MPAQPPNRIPTPVFFNYRGLEYEARAVIDFGAPENLRGHPDTWTPVGGDEIEDAEIYRIIRGWRWKKLTEETVDRLLNDSEFVKAMLEKARGKI